jgi:peptidoglycan/xylan/chitin deacetylase (PgdA/CDA1 family)
MHRYFIKTPWIVKKLFADYVWDIAADEKEVYFTFDDGPHPTITPWVLEQLALYDAKATFFCIGNNVKQHAAIYRCILAEGHSTGNHTQHHINGWKSSTEEYLHDVAQAAELIDSSLFRPPYGKIRNAQAAKITHAMKKKDAQIIMWDVLSADFNTNFSPQQCLEHVLQHVVPGSVVVFHDSEKAFPNLQHVLPAALKSLQEDGYRFLKIKDGRV